MRSRVLVTLQAIGALGPPAVRPVATRAVAVGLELVQAGLDDLAVAGVAADALRAGRSMWLVARRAGEPHRRVLGEAGWVEALRPVAAQTVAPRRAQAGLDGEEVVAGEAVELLHPRGADGVLAVTAPATRHRGLEAVHARPVALHAVDLLLDHVDAVAAVGSAAPERKF